ncbi:MAG: hypothetical protein HY710_01440 [Candidatus Latescibacteria bacterium]|nr:hypothetical protein [Candidatus Latescibacterota bacterium]
MGRPRHPDPVPSPAPRLLSCCPTLFLVFVLAQAVGSPSSSIARVGEWTTYTFANEVRAIAFDRGAIWCATAGGGVRFDPTTSRFATYTNADGLSGNDVTSLAVDRNGDVWFGTRERGLSRRRGDTGGWRTYTPLDGLASERVGAVFIRGNTLWVGTQDGLSVFVWGTDVDERRDTFVFSDAYRASRGVPLANTQTIAFGETTIWAGTENGVATAQYTAANLKDPANWTTYTVAHGLPDDRVTALAVSGTEAWAGTPAGVARFDGTRWQTMNTGLLSTDIRGLAFIEGTLWAATGAEVAKLDGSTWHQVGGGVGPSGARTVAADSTGTVWIGAARNGLGRLEQGEWRFSASNGPAGNVIDALFIDRRGHVWCGLDEGGVSRFDGTEWVTYTTADGLAPGPVVMIGEDRAGIRWFGTFGHGLSRLDDNGTLAKDDDHWRTFDQRDSTFAGVPEDPAFVVVNAWAIDQSGGQWFSNFGAGALFLNTDGRWAASRPRADELSSARIRGIAVGTDSSVWFATDDRLSRFRPDRRQWQVYSTQDGLLSNQVNAVTVAEDGTVWVGTDAGVNRFEGEVQTPLALPSGLNTAAVSALATDARGRLWAGTRQGLAVLDPETLDWQVSTVDNSPLAHPLVKSITVKTTTGEVWIGTGGGVSRFESGVLPVRTTLSDVLVYPNPFIPSRGDAAVVFDRLADGAMVSILTAAGELVRQIRPEEIVAQQAHWDGRNDAGRPVAGGVYFFVITTPDGRNRTGKVAVIR